MQSVKFLGLVSKRRLRWKSEIECIDLTDDVIKILGIYFSYNKEIEQEKNYLNHIVKIQFY